MIKENICKAVKLFLTITVIIYSVQKNVVKETRIVIMIPILKWENRHFKKVSDLPNSCTACHLRTKIQSNVFVRKVLYCFIMQTAKLE